jgi:DMSO/TMAO reductase YedYZ molybdopterin-dependent catalytic subunit
MTTRNGFTRVRHSGWWGALSGALAAAVAMGIAQLVAGFTVPASSPVVAVGEAAIDHTPLAVKDWATSTFGTNDKTVLLAGVLIVVFLYSMVVGALAMRRLWLGFAGLVLFAVLGIAAAVTRHGASGGYAAPTLFGAAAGALCLYWLVVTARAAAGIRADTGGGADEVDAWIAHRPPAAGSSSAGPVSGLDAWTDRPGLAGAGGADGGATDGSGGTRAADEEIGWLPAGGGSADAPLTGAGAGTGGAGGGGSSPGGRVEGFRAGPPTSGAVGNGLPDARDGGERRRFLVAAGVTVAAAAIGEVGGRNLATRKNVSLAQSTLRFPKAAEPVPPLPAGVNLPVPGISPFITPNGSFYRVDTAILVPQVDPSNWQLRIHGMVAREVTINFGELLRRPLKEDYLTLCCVSNPVGGPYIGNAKWLGTDLAALLREARPLRGADQLLATSVDGFTSGTPLSVVLDGRDAMVAVAMNGAALPTAHGFPARLVVPGLYGYVSACKWVVDLEVTTFAAAQAYWVPRGWSAMGPIKTESRIDVPVPGSQVKAGKVAVAGVAWAQHKGIEAVEVQVGNGPWQEATLAAVPGIDTWRQWVWEWDAQPGNYTIQARATDKTGYTQTSAIAYIAPNGATGYPSTQVSVV